MLGGPPNLQGETLTKDRHLRLRFPILFNRANIHTRLAHVVLTVMLETDVALFFGPMDWGYARSCIWTSENDPSRTLGE